VDAKGHEMGEWTVTKPATESAVGEEKRECANCDHVETREIPKKAIVFHATLGGLEGLFNAYQMGVGNEHAGFSGTGFVSGFFCNPGAHITFTVNVPADGEYDVTMGYAMGTNEAKGNPGTLAIYVNRNKVGSTTFEPGADWATYLEKTEKLTLKKGENTITYWAENAFGDPAPNIDYIEISGTKYEAEDAVFPNHMGGSEQLEGFYNNPEAAVQYTISGVKADGTYILSITYANGNPEAQDQPAKLALLINGKYVTELALKCTGTWGDYKTYTTEIELTKGTNNITLWKTGAEPQGANIKTVVVEGANPDTGDSSVILAAAVAMVASAAAVVLLKKKEEEIA
jgi:LPXTG-motif cell wall-anchored protein